MSLRAFAPIAALIATIATAGAEPALQCQDPQKSWVMAELLFGRTGVNEASWARFLASEVTPRFPDGLTVLDARGQWRAPGGAKIVREPSKVLMIAMPPGAENNAKLNAIADAYKRRFKQQSVGIVIRAACVSF